MIHTNSAAVFPNVGQKMAGKQSPIANVQIMAHYLFSGINSKQI